jgi:hypothetical protein
MSAFRYITIPEPAEHPAGAKISLHYVVGFIIDQDKRFTSGRKGMFAAQRMSESFEGAEPGTVVAIHPEDWALLSKAIEEPTCGYPELVGSAPDGRRVSIPIGRKTLLPLLDVVLDATTKKPEPVAQEVAPEPAPAEAAE